MLSLERSFEIFPRHNRVAAISESFALNLITSVQSSQCKFKQKLCSVKLIENIFSAVTACSNLCVGPLPRIEIYFFLLSVCGDELISTPKIVTFLANPIAGNPNVPFISNPIPYPEYLYLSISASFLLI